MIKLHDRAPKYIWIIVALMAVILCNNCGKKAPPSVPRQPAMKAVADLAAKYKEGMVVLTWHHPPSSSAVTGYHVFRAGRDTAMADCPGCPILFEKIETFSLNPDKYRVRHPLSFSQSVAIGFRYTYKVVPMQSSGAQGPDSNLVKVDAIQ